MTGPAGKIPGRAGANLLTRKEMPLSLFEDVIKARESELATCREYIRGLEAQVADLVSKLEGDVKAVETPAPVADPPAPEVPADPAPAEVPADPAPVADPPPVA